MRGEAWFVAWLVMASVTRAVDLPRETSLLTELTDSQAEAVAKGGTGSLSLNGLPRLDAATATKLARSTRWDRKVPNLKTLDVATVSALAGVTRAGTGLESLTRLDAAMAGPLAKFAGQALSLDGLAALDTATAEALANLKGRFHMPKVLAALGTPEVPLSAATARLLVASINKSGSGHELYQVQALDGRDAVEIARILTTCEGPLSLPNLKRISPRTLSALIEKNDVEIPLVETLELIPEPDGSPNDDFVVPAWLEQRERERQRQERENELPAPE